MTKLHVAFAQFCGEMPTMLLAKYCAEFAVGLISCFFL